MVWLGKLGVENELIVPLGTSGQAMLARRSTWSKSCLWVGLRGSP